MAREEFRVAGRKQVGNHKLCFWKIWLSFLFHLSFLYFLLGAQNNDYQQQQFGNRQDDGYGGNRGGDSSNSGNYSNGRGQSNYRRGGRR